MIEDNKSTFAFKNVMHWRSHYEHIVIVSHCTRISARIIKYFKEVPSKSLNALDSAT